MSKPAQRGRRQNASLRQGITSVASRSPVSPSSLASAPPVVADSTVGGPREQWSEEVDEPGSHRAGHAASIADSIAGLPGSVDFAAKGSSRLYLHDTRSTSQGSHTSSGDQASRLHLSSRHDESRPTTHRSHSTTSHERNAKSARPALNKTSQSTMRSNRTADQATRSSGGGGNTAAGDATSSPASGSSRFTPSPHTGAANVPSDPRFHNSAPGRAPYTTSPGDPTLPQGDALAITTLPYPPIQGGVFLPQASPAGFQPSQAHQHLHQTSHHQQHSGYSGHGVPYGNFHPPPPRPLSPSSVQQQYSQSMGGEATQQAHRNYEMAMQPTSGDASVAAGSDASVRAVSPAGSQPEASAETYVYPYMAGSDPAAGHHPYYAAGPLAPAFAPGQYGPSNPYAMQYYPSYAPPAFYGARPHGWMPPLTAAQQHGWQRPSYYPAFPTGGPAAPQPAYQHRSPMPHPMHGRPRGPAPSPHSSGQRGAGGSSRTSSGNNVHSVQRSVSSSSYAATSPESTRQSRTAHRSASSASQQALQGQGPRSEHVLWCGNVPADVTLDELWAFFSSLPPEWGTLPPPEHARDSATDAGDDATAIDADEQSHGVLSIFVIARSNCAFVNYATPQHLQRALDFFQGQMLRPHDPRCPKLVCRVRKKDDEAQAGVAGQRGRGIHVAWLKEQERLAKVQVTPADESGVSLSDERSQLDQQQRRNDGRDPLDLQAANAELKQIRHESAPPSNTPAIVREASTPTPQQKSGSLLSPSQPRPSVDSSSGSAESVSYASTNSSLFRHPAFRERFFILKSSHVKDLDRSVETGMWATQPHNEAVLDQAYRNSEKVFLIFSANQSGGFYGYARMNGTIHPTPERGATARPFSIPEHDESDTPSKAPPVASPLPISTDDDEQSSAAEPAAATSSPVMSHSKSGQGPVHHNQTLKPQGAQSYRSAKSSEARRAIEVPNNDASSDQVITVSPLSIEDIDPLKGTNHANPMERLSINSAFSEPLQTTSKATHVASYSSETPSISPLESASYPSDTRSQNQLAIRALIHNLRLDAKESVHRAKQLEAVEAEMKAQEVAGDVSSNGSSGGAGHAGDQSSDSLDKAPIVIKPQPLASSAETWGKPFKVEWLKVGPISFPEVRMLRNPWRDNRQVKVSRDGTELEPHVGRRLLEFWATPAENEARRQSGDARSALSSTFDDDEEEDAA